MPLSHRLPARNAEGRPAEGRDCYRSLAAECAASALVSMDRSISITWRQTTGRLAGNDLTVSYSNVSLSPPPEQGMTKEARAIWLSVSCVPSAY